MFLANVSKYDNSSRSLMFEFEEATPTSISCKIIGGNPIPHLRILHGKKDITDSFQFRQHCDVEGPPGLQINKYTSELYSDTFTVNEDWRGTTLKCVAKVPRRSELRRVKTATIEVICTFKILHSAFLETCVNEHCYSFPDKRTLYQYDIGAFWKLNLIVWLIC